MSFLLGRMPPKRGCESRRTEVTHDHDPQPTSVGATRNRLLALQVALTGCLRTVQMGVQGGSTTGSTGASSSSNSTSGLTTAAATTGGGQTSGDTPTSGTTTGRCSDQGDFAAMVVYPLQGQPETVLLADVNGDGVLDAVMSNWRSPFIEVLIGKGDGTFPVEQTYPTSTHPRAMGAADLNGDGITDLIAVLSEASEVEVLLGTDDGGFASGVIYPTGGFPDAITIGDVDGDNILDLLVPNAGDGSADAGFVSVLLGRGDGTFANHVDFAAGTEPAQGVLGDFNGDGNPDFALVNTPTNVMTVLWGTHGGGFGPPQVFLTETQADGIMAGDFNGDGIVDLLVAAYNNGYSGWVTTFMGEFDGGFEPGQNFDWGSSPTQTALADFNGDGIPDLALCNTGSPGLGIRLGVGSGDFGSETEYSANLNGPSAMAVGDLNGDGLPDVVMTMQLSRQISTNGLGVFINQYCGAITPTAQVDAGQPTTGYVDGGCLPGREVILTCSTWPDGGGGESECIGTLEQGCNPSGTPYCTSPCTADEYGQTTTEQPGPNCRSVGIILGAGAQELCCTCGG
jgi:hypothetical protein